MIEIYEDVKDADVKNADVKNADVIVFAYGISLLKQYICIELA